MTAAHAAAIAADRENEAAELAALAKQYRTVVVEWTETSSHRRTINVPIDFTDDDLGDCLPDDLGSLDDDGFQSLERDVDTITAATEFDPDAEVLG